MTKHTLILSALGALALTACGQPADKAAETAAGIARGGLNPDILEGTVAQYLAVRDAIERDAAGEELHASANIDGRRSAKTEVNSVDNSKN